MSQSLRIEDFLDFLFTFLPNPWYNSVVRLRKAHFKESEMQVFYLKDTVHTDAQGRQTRDERRTDLTFGLDWCAKRGVEVPTIDTLSDDYDLVFESVNPVEEMGVRGLEGVFHDFQGEFMPVGVKMRLSRDRSHTSMSVGDLILDHGNLWFCDSDGWTLIGKVS